MSPPFSVPSINRRAWLRLGSAAMVGTLAGKSSAAEGRGKWSDQSSAAYTVKLMDWLKADFARRASALATATGAEFKLEYDYLLPAEDNKARQRAFAKFAEGRMADKAAAEHITACLTEYETVRKSLAAAEAKAAAGWKAPEEGGAAEREGNVYDSLVKSARLTVVLDNSRSMAPFLDAVRAEISRDFSSAYFVEVNGCEMSRSEGCPWFYCAPTPATNPFSPERHIPKVPTVADSPHSTFIRWTRDAPAALGCMVDLMQTDAIYWFCDFDDPVRDEVAQEFARKVTAKKVRLYIHTLGKRPPTLLASLAESSGGQVVRKRI